MNKTGKMKEINIVWACGFGHAHKTKVEGDKCILRHLNNITTDIEKALQEFRDKFIKPIDTYGQDEYDKPEFNHGNCVLCGHDHFDGKENFELVEDFLRQSLLSVREKTLRDCKERILLIDDLGEAKKIIRGELERNTNGK